MSATRPVASVSTSEAYGRCEAITRTQAANFYYGIRLLAHDRRRAMCAAYAFARRVDDIGDGPLPPDAKLRELDVAAADLSALERGDPLATSSSDPVIVALADAHRRFSLPAGALGELIEGVRMDVEGLTYESFEDLVLYCRRVAGAIGRVCLAIFGRSQRRLAGAELQGRAQIDELADDLGVALQITNILRDVREDAQNGRVYLPAEDLRRFGVISGDGAPDAAQLLASLQGDPLVALVRFEAERAERWFARGTQLVPLLDRRSAACVLAMAGIYHRLLERIASDPRGALGARASLPAHEKLWVALRSMLGDRRAIGTGA